MTNAFQHRLEETAEAVQAWLDLRLGQLEQETTPPHLANAMRHGVLNGGKRLRPFLVVEAAALFGVECQTALPTACALELVHCYSLVHDDLPAMDDDDLRRGQPTVHIAFDEATAILAGDALLTLAFEILSSRSAHPDPAIRGELTGLLAKAAGCAGMVGGQALDLAAETDLPDEKGIRQLQAMKTGALIRFACEAGAVLGAASGDRRQAILRYGEKIGLAFQLADDILDVTASAEAMGKATGKDEVRGKATLVGVHGLEKSKDILAATVADALAALDGFGVEADTLRRAAHFIAERKN